MDKSWSLIILSHITSSRTGLLNQPYEKRWLSQLTILLPSTPGLGRTLSFRPGSSCTILSAGFSLFCFFLGFWFILTYVPGYLPLVLDCFSPGLFLTLMTCMIPRFFHFSLLDNSFRRFRLSELYRGIKLRQRVSDLWSLRFSSYCNVGTLSKSIDLFYTFTYAIMSHILTIR